MITTMELCFYHSGTMPHGTPMKILILIMIERMTYSIDLPVIITLITLAPCNIRVFQDPCQNTQRVKKEERDQRWEEDPRQKEKELERLPVFSTSFLFFSQTLRNQFWTKG